MRPHGILKTLDVLDAILLAFTAILVIPAGMWFDGGPSAKVWTAFILVVTMPAAFLVSMFFVSHYERRGLPYKAIAAASAPLAWMVFVMINLILLD